jgi:exonuclease I
MPNFKLATVYKEMFGKDIENAHDAMADIEATREIASVCIKGIMEA